MRQLTLRGSAKERGLMHGKTWSKEIHELAQIRIELLNSALKGWTSSKIKNLVTLHLEVLQKDHELWEEFKGICEGAKISEHDLMILNNHTDLRDFSFAQNDPELNESLNECSAFALKTSHGIIAGQTWDMHGSASPYVAHLTIHKKNGNQEITQEIFTLTGCLALTGINSLGLGVFINNLRSSEMSIGLAWPALIRKILDEGSLQAAEKCIENNLPSGGRSFLLSDQNQAVGFEVTGKQIKSFGKTSNKAFLAHTNHYLTDLKETEDLESRSKSTFDRLEKITSLLEKTSESKSQIKSATELADYLLLQDISNILCIPVSPQNPHASATCGGMLYDFTQKKGFSFNALYKNKDLFSFE